MEDMKISPSSYATIERGAGDSVVTDIINDFWAWRLRTSPEFASYCGVHDYDDLLDNIDNDVLTDSKESVQAFLNRCKAVDTKSVSTPAQLDLILLKEDLETFLTGVPYNRWVLPLNFLEGVHIDIHLLISFTKFEKEEDFNTYVKRLKCYPKQIAQVKQMCEEGIKHGLVNHCASMINVPSQIDSLTNDGKLDAEKSTFLSPFNKENENVSKEIVKKIRQEAIEVVEKLVIPAFVDLKEFVTNVYMRNTRPSPGISCLPDGADHYQQCLNYHTTTTLTPKEVHDLGLREVSRIIAQFHKITEAEGFGKDILAFQKHLKSNRDLFYKSEEELLSGVKKICFERIRPNLSKMFKDIPDTEMIIKAAPKSMSNAPAGFYMAGTYDGSRPGIYYINTTEFAEVPKYEMMALSLHEGEPGHHLQSMFAIHQKGVPEFRQYIEDMKYSRAPARFTIHTGFMEGWGLYAESLGEDFDLYADNYELFGRYCFEILRAARLVVDTGMHAMGWSQEKAENYLLDTALMSEYFTKNEIQRYITWPGQACAYKIGELKIKELRQKAKDTLGDRFDIRDFHEAVLGCGLVPLNILESMVVAYIEEASVSGH